MIDQEKEKYTAEIVLGALSILGGLIFAISGWVLSITGISLNSKNKIDKDVKIGLKLSIIGLVVSVINSIAGVILNLFLY